MVACFFLTFILFYLICECLSTFDYSLSTFVVILVELDLEFVFLNVDK